VLSATVVGVLSVKRPSTAAALVLAAALLVVIAVRIEVIPLALVSTIFIEEVALGGLTIGRIAGVLALAAMAYYVLASGQVALRMSCCWPSRGSTACGCSSAPTGPRARLSSLTRTALLSIVGVALLALVLPWRVLFRSAVQKATYAVSLAVTAGIVLTVAATATFFARVGSIFSGLNSTGDRGAGRTDLWAAAWNAYSHHPWFGIGAGNFQSQSFDLLSQTRGVDIAAS
jgi:hypothetical protein